MSFYELLGRFSKVFKKGPVWVLLRIRYELRSPSFRTTKRVMVAFKTVEKMVCSLFYKDDSFDEDYVTAVYDLNTQTETFDFSIFLAGAELFAQKNGKESFVVLFVLPNKDHEVIGSKLNNPLFEEGMFRWRFENIVLSLVNLCPACIGYSVLPKNLSLSEEIKGKLVFPEFYDGKYNPTDFSREVFQSENKFVGLRATVQGIKYIKSWKESNKIMDNIVTITLRNYTYLEVRNSNIPEWVKFAKLVRSEGFTPVFVPDTFTCFEKDNRLDGFIVFRDPCWNLSLRMALYEQSYLNFSVASGPACICHVNKKVNAICMKQLTENSSYNNESFYKDMGIKIGQRKYPFAEEHQILSWEEDNFESISEEFYKFLKNHPRSS